MAEFIEHPLIKKKSVEKREYQQNLTQSVMEKGNSLIVAPTALGKTIIAVLVIAKKLKESKGKVLFLAPTRPLVLQHSKTIKELMEIDGEMAIITGKTKPKERAEQFKRARIVCSTPQCIRNDLKKERISLKDTVLCIFDEAHRAVGEYAYVEIAERFRKERPSGLVLAITASPGHKREKIEKIGENLGIENFKIKTRLDEDVKPYVKEIKIEWREVKLPREFKRIIELIKNYSKKHLSDLKRMGQVESSDPKRFSRSRLLKLQKKISARIKKEGKRVPSLYGIASKVACVLMASHALLLIETQGVQALRDYFEKRLEKSKNGRGSRSMKMFLKDKRIKQAIVETRKLSSQGTEHPKLTELKKIIQSQLAQKKNSRIIVFNHYRDSVVFLTQKVSELENARVHRFVGQASKGKTKGLSQQEQAKILNSFKSGEFNVLIATSVAEEGLDIPACDLVVFYEPVPSEIRYIQRRGRTGRIKKGKAIILMAKNTRDEAFYWSAKRKEGKMKRLLKKMQSNEKQKKLGEFNEKKEN